MVTIEVRLDKISANPWQPRQNEDAEHIKNLALSIAQDGLMQVPVGRLIDLSGEPVNYEEALKTTGVVSSVREAWAAVFGTLGCRVQLAFGHSRLSAYKWLADVKNNSNLAGDWTSMPVLVRDLEDEEMFRMAISENLQRRDLNPIEEARAMEHYRDDFHKTSAEIGELFGLAESSVRNKMRLLGLPAEIQEAASKGTISEGAARELLTYYDLPAELQKMGENVAYTQGNGLTRASIVRQALAGLTADQVREMITALIRQAGRDLSNAEWKWDAVYDRSMDRRIASETCKECPMRIQREKNWYCLAVDCWRAREDINKRELLAKASAATGIRPAEDSGRGYYDYVRLEEESAAEIRASGCDHLRLIASESYNAMRKGMLVDGHPGVVVMCDHKNGQCSCAKGIEARAKLKAAGISVQRSSPSGAPGASAQQEKSGAQTLPVTTITKDVPNEALSQAKIGNAADLKDLANQGRRAARQMREEVKAMQEDMARRMATAFENRNPRVMAELLLGFVYSTERYKFAQVSAEEVLFKAALHFAEAQYDLNYYTTPDLGVALKRFNEFLKSAELAEMTSMVETPADEPVYEPVDHFPDQQPGDTLMDYFARTDGQGA